MAAVPIDDGGDVLTSALGMPGPDLWVGDGTYRMTTPFVWDGKPVLVRGSGPASTSTTELGGVVLSVPPDGTGILSAADLGRALHLHYLAVVGDDKTGTGLDFGTGNQNNYFETRDVLLKNLGVGARFNDALDHSHYDLKAQQCAVGLDYVSVAAEHSLYSPRLEYNDVAVRMRGAGDIHLYGGLIQSNLVGINFYPVPVYGINNISLSGVYFEGNGVDYILDSSAGPIVGLTFMYCNSKTNSDVPIPGPVLNGIANLIYFNCDFAGQTLTIDGRFYNVTLVAGRFAKVIVYQSILNRVTFVGFDMRTVEIFDDTAAPSAPVGGAICPKTFRFLPHETVDA